MAIPTDLFANSYGIALMRHNTVEWDFIGWVTNGFSYVEELPPGNYTYQLWLVVGSRYNASTGSSPNRFNSVRMEGASRLSVMRAKK